LWKAVQLAIYTKTEQNPDSDEVENVNHEPSDFKTIALNTWPFRLPPPSFFLVWSMLEAAIKE